MGSRSDDPAEPGDALQAEEIEKRNENLRLLYVACTRAMELLIVPDFTWSNDASWAKLLDFKLDEVPELNIARLPRSDGRRADRNRKPAKRGNICSRTIAAGRGFPEHSVDQTQRWRSGCDPNPAPPKPAGREPLQPSSVDEGGRMRGVILHKLMEELMTGELEERLDDVKSRAAFLLEQLTSEALAANSPAHR